MSRCSTLRLWKAASASNCGTFRCRFCSRSRQTECQSTATSSADAGTSRQAPPAVEEDVEVASLAKSTRTCTVDCTSDSVDEDASMVGPSRTLTAATLATTAG